MDYLPIGLQLRGRRVLLVGQGSEARQRAALVARFGGQLDWWRENEDAELEARVANSGGQLLDPEQGARLSLAPYVLVLVAGSTSLDLDTLAADALAQAIPLNRTDGVTGTAILPALVDRDPLLISIHSNGMAPGLARWLRGRLESAIPASLGRVAEFMRDHRARVSAVISRPAARRAFWDRLLDSSVLERVLSRDRTGADAGLQRALDDASRTDSETGEVYLVGAGPGDPDLMTFRALRLLQQADVVLYDRLVAPAIVSLARQDAEMVYVGKERDRHALPQEQINDLLVHYARQGKRVCRLKGGDPFIFGRGGEELEKVAAARIPFQVVPGVTAAAGCAAYAGIPLTHRDFAQSVRFVTGHRKDGSIDLPWQTLMAPQETLVFYMGLVTLPEISAQLQAHGMAADMPAALVARGTTAEQRVLVGTLASLPDLARDSGVKAPTLIIVGEVVSLYPLLRWYQPELDVVGDDAQ